MERLRTIAIRQTRQVSDILQGDYKKYTKDSPLVFKTVEYGTGFYCDLQAGKEYEFRVSTDITYNINYGIGSQAYLLKDETSSIRIGLINRQVTTDSIPETSVYVAQGDTDVVVVFTAQVSGRYYLRLDNFEYKTRDGVFWDIRITEKNSIIAPITDSAERNAQVQGDDYIKIVWSDNKCNIIPALSYVDYQNERFYLKANYIPTKKADDLFSYSVKFVKVHCLFSDAMFLRSVDVEGVTWQEPQFDINANKQIMTDMVVDSINHLPFINKLGITFLKPYNQATDDKFKEYSNTTLQAFSFDCSKVAEVLNNIAETYETEWWVEDTEDVTVKVLHIDKCMTDDFTLELSDKYVEEEDNTYTSYGLTSVEPDTSNEIPERIYVYGSERNITKKTVQQQVEGGVMNVSYAKKLRLNNKKEPYETTTKSGVAVIVNTNESSISIKNVSNGRMDSYTNEEIYPKMTMTISEVREERNSEDMPFFYLKSNNLTSDFMDSEIAEGYPDSLNPSRQGLLIEGTTLMVTFTSGMLNGMEFECAWYQSRAEIGIIPDESEDQQIPYGNIKPKVGDTFVLWNLMMPQSSVEKAQEELLADALEYVDSIIETVNGCKCKTDAQYFFDNNLTRGIKLGRRIKIDSEVFTNTIFNNSSLTSRVKSFSYKLTKPYDITFNLHEARTEGVLSSFENTITDIKIDAKQTTQLARSISRRQTHDIDEMAKMIESIKTQMLVVGEEHDNFSITSELVYNDKAKALSVSIGVLQHATYIEYGQNGAWEIRGFEKSFTESQAGIPYYIYARCNKNDTEANIEVSETKKGDTASYFYFLIGILSSEYEGSRVFNRTSGLSTITGGTITTEQIQDYGRNLIIDFSSNPPRIIARNGAIIEGAIKFTSLTDSENIDVQEVINDASNNAEQAVSTAKTAVDNINTLNNKTKPLYEALNSSTEVVGGLVNTNVLMVKDNQSRITGGISGLDDNIAFWSGGTYQDAKNGKCNIIIRKDGTAKIGVFNIANNQASIDLGEGNYARMSPNGIEVSLENQGKAKFDTSGVTIFDNNANEKIKLIDGKVSIDKFILNSYTQSVNSIDDIVITTIPQASGKTIDLTSKGTSLGWTVSTTKNNINYTLNIYDLVFQRQYNDSVTAQAQTEYYNVKILLEGTNGSSKLLATYAVRIKFEGNNVATYSIAKGVTVTSSNADSIEWTNSSTGSHNSSISLDGLFVSKENGWVNPGTYKLIAFVNSLSSSPRSGTIRLTNTRADFDIVVENYTPKTLIGTNGMFNFQTSYKYFGAYLDDNDVYHIVGKANDYKIEQVQ